MKDEPIATGVIKIINESRRRTYKLLIVFVVISIISFLLFAWSMYDSIKQREIINNLATEIHTKGLCNAKNKIHD